MTTRLKRKGNPVGREFRKPPLFASWILKKILPQEDDHFLTGDFEETYNDVYLEKGVFKSWLWYWKQVFRSIPLFINNNISNGVSMLQNYLKIALRNILKQKLNTAINIIGLSLGLCCCILIVLFVTDELSYDSFHDKADQIYKFKWNDKYYETSWANVPEPLGAAAVDFFPGIAKKIRFVNRGVIVRYGENIIDEFFAFADRDFFDVFSFPLLKGDSETVLSTENSIVLTETSAENIFGNIESYGKTLSIQIGDEIRDFIVTGICRDLPHNTTVLFNAVIPFNNLRFYEYDDIIDNWARFGINTYIMLERDTAPDQVLSRIEEFSDQYMDTIKQQRIVSNRWKEGSCLELRNIRDLYLDPSMRGRLYSDTTKSYILSGIALIVLIIACINFTNLSIGRSSGRSLEIGVRKVMGAAKKQLIRQYWIESMLMTGIALLFGIVITILILPEFNQMTQKSFSIRGIFGIKIITAMLGLVFIVGLSSAVYPALLIAKYKPVEIFRQKLRIGSNNSVTKGLVIAQFLFSVLLISSTLIMSRQIRYIDNHELGFDKEGLLSIRIQENSPDESRRLIELFRSETMQSDNIINISASSTSFGVMILSAATTINGKRIDTNINSVYFDYVKTLGMKLVEGRDFSREYLQDTASIVVTKKLVESFGIENPVGQIVRVGRFPAAKIIGVVEDFNFESLEHEAGPAMLNMNPGQRLGFMLVRISSQNLSGTIDLLEAIWKKIQPDKPFRYSFVDADLARHYDDDRRWSSILRYSSIFVVLIACMGIFGLTSITISNRTKEIGIRKVLGAKISQISGLIIKEYIILILTANFIAWPLIYYIMDKYLSEFYYRIDIEPAYLALAGILTLTLTVLTVIYLALKSALSNPVSSLRYE